VLLVERRAEYSTSPPVSVVSEVLQKAIASVSSEKNALSLEEVTPKAQAREYTFTRTSNLLVFERKVQYNLKPEVKLNRQARRKAAMEDTTPWDTNLKALVEGDPKAFINWTVGKGDFVKFLPLKVRGLKIECDVLMIIEIDGIEQILHLEIQSYHSSKIPKRMADYQLNPHDMYEMAVIPVVIYLLRDAAEPINLQAEMSLKLEGPVGHPNHFFYYTSIELGWYSIAALLAVGEHGLLPLLTLTRDGTTREVVQYMRRKLGNGHDESLNDALNIGLILAELTFERDNLVDLFWLKGEIAKMTNLLKQSPYYKSIKAEGVAEERARWEQERADRELALVTERNEREKILAAVRTEQEKILAVERTEREEMLQMQRELILEQVGRFLPDLFITTFKHVQQMQNPLQLQCFLKLLLNHPDGESVQGFLSKNG
jgi:hypothetical protein